MIWIGIGLVVLLFAVIAFVPFAIIWDEVKIYSGEGYAKLARTYRISSDALWKEENPFEKVYWRERKNIRYILSILIALAALIATALIFDQPVIGYWLCVPLTVTLLIFAFKDISYIKLKAQYKRYPEFRKKTIHAYDFHDAFLRSFLQNMKEYFKTLE